MKAVRFTADNASAALAQIQTQLGPDAVVLDVRQLPATGLARLWPGNRRVEVLAGVPDPAPEPDPNSFAFGDILAEDFTREMRAGDGQAPGLWPTVAWLAAMGLEPDFAHRFQAHLNALHPGPAPSSRKAERAIVSAALAGFWSEATPTDGADAGRPHVFIGPPGSGKTTTLCKWMTLAVLTEEKRAAAWQLDGGIANAAEFLGIHCEMLGVPLKRFWTEPTVRADLNFVDLPGVEIDDVRGITALRAQLASLPSPRLHLVLNAACETTVLTAQWHAFAALEPEDLIFTHLDEEIRRVKLWNFVFGTNCSLRFLSAGQKIPGEFLRAAPRLLFPREISRKSRI